jgi:hypothetical protein
MKSLKRRTVVGIDMIRNNRIEHMSCGDTQTKFLLQHLAVLGCISYFVR